MPTAGRVVLTAALPAARRLRRRASLRWNRPTAQSRSTARLQRTDGEELASPADAFERVEAERDDVVAAEGSG